LEVQERKTNHYVSFEVVIMIKTVEEFYNTFDMQVRVSNRRLRRIDRASLKMNAWAMEVSDAAMYQSTATHSIEEVECVDVLMPKDRLAHLIAYVQETEARNVQHESDRQLIAQYERDRAIRLKYPSVEKAYQKYVTMLELCRK
jgi:hypothetical protein